MTGPIVKVEALTPPLLIFSSQLPLPLCRTDLLPPSHHHDSGPSSHSQARDFDVRTSIIIVSFTNYLHRTTTRFNDHLQHYPAQSRNRGSGTSSKRGKVVWPNIPTTTPTHADDLTAQRGECCESENVGAFKSAVFSCRMEMQEISLRTDCRAWLQNNTSNVPPPRLRK